MTIKTFIEILNEESSKTRFDKVKKEIKKEIGKKSGDGIVGLFMGSGANRKLEKNQQYNVYSLKDGKYLWVEYKSPTPELDWYISQQIN